MDVSPCEILKSGATRLLNLSSLHDIFDLRYSLYLPYPDSLESELNIKHYAKYINNRFKNPLVKNDPSRNKGFYYYPDIYISTVDIINYYLLKYGRWPNIFNPVCRQDTIINKVVYLQCGSKLFTCYKNQHSPGDIQYHNRRQAEKEDPYAELSDMFKKLGSHSHVSWKRTLQRTQRRRRKKMLQDLETNIRRQREHEMNEYMDEL